MHHPSTAAIALRAVFVLFTAVGLALLGIALDISAGTGPAATLIFLCVGVTFGTIMILVIIASSFSDTRKQ
jgi:F0F1-type ATP synthase assembly protein I